MNLPSFFASRPIASAGYPVPTLTIQTLATRCGFNVLAMISNVESYKGQANGRKGAHAAHTKHHLLQVPTQLMECIFGHPQAVQYVSQVHLEKLTVFVEVPRHTCRFHGYGFKSALPLALRALLCPNQWLRAIRACGLKVRCPLRSKLPRDKTQMESTKHGLFPASHSNTQQMQAAEQQLGILHHENLASIRFMLHIACNFCRVHENHQPGLVRTRNSIGSKLEPPPDKDFRRSISASSTSNDVMADVVCELRENSAL